MKRDERRRQMQVELRSRPFLTDEQMAEILGVSVATIRLDRAALGIPEVRLRMSSAAQDGLLQQQRTGPSYGELLELKPNHSAISLVHTHAMMVDDSGLIPSQVLYGIANDLAMKVLQLPVALCGVGNIKYKAPVYPDERLVFKLHVVRNRGPEHYVWVKAMRACEEVFRTKFIMKEYTEVKG